jgi:hypothetical protein
MSPAGPIYPAWEDLPCSPLTHQHGLAGLAQLKRAARHVGLGYCLSTDIQAGGDWKPEWRDQRSGNTLIGWKWRHESPSPEPEDLSGLEDLATFELTPSEVDALEAVPPPSPPTPQPYIPLEPGATEPLSLTS